MIWATTYYVQLYYSFLHARSDHPQWQCGCGARGLRVCMCDDMRMGWPAARSRGGRCSCGVRCHCRTPARTGIGGSRDWSSYARARSTPGPELGTTTRAPCSLQTRPAGAEDGRSPYMPTWAANTHLHLDLSFPPWAAHMQCKIQTQVLRRPSVARQLLMLSFKIQKNFRFWHRSIFLFVFDNYYSII